LAKKKLSYVFEQLRLPDILWDGFLNKLEASFSKSVTYIRKHGLEAVATNNKNLMNSMLNIFHGVMKDIPDWVINNSGDGQEEY
jgi:hypothetical protein